jgi:hypothetical protein
MKNKPTFTPIVHTTSERNKYHSIKLFQLINCFIYTLSKEISSHIIRCSTMTNNKSYFVQLRSLHNLIMCGVRGNVVG